MLFSNSHRTIYDKWGEYRGSARPSAHKSCLFFEVRTLKTQYIEVLLLCACMSFLAFIVSQLIVVEFEPIS